MTAEDVYLRAVERMLRSIRSEHRATVLDDLRAHFADADDAGRSVEETVQALGTPEEIAARAREEFGRDDARAEWAWRVLQGTAVALALITGVVVAFIMPSYSSVSPEGPATTTIVERLGLAMALVALVPALVAAVPLVVPRRTRAATITISAVVLTAMALIGGFSLGGLFLPTVLLSWTALIVWVRLRGSGFGTGWRITGAAMTIAPTLLLLGSVGMGGAFDISAWAWPVLAVIVVLAVLIGLGIRAAGWLLAAIGLIGTVAGLISGGLLTLLVIWLGGWWLTIGLAHAVTAPRRS